ncbi:unnamed protein product [Effrenium voratum]|nr:unnamed protein product [Effrenium voratum]
MNETFWMPADMPSYQAAEYGAEAKGSCQAGALGFEYSGALPKAAEVMRQQRELAQKQRASIAAAAAYDRRLWHKYLAKNGVSWGYAGKPDSAPVSPFEPHLGAGLGLRRVLLLCAALLAAAALYVCGRRLTACSRQSAYAALLQPSEGAVLALYLALLLAQSLSQHLAAASGHLALLAALALQLAQLVWAAAVVHHTLGLSSVWSLETRQPLATLGLTFLLGFCSAVSQWLSFVSLFWLDPATYLVILQVSLRLVEVAACSRQRFSSRHWLALGVFVTAVLLKGLKAASEQDMALYRGLLALLAQVLLSSLAVLCQPLLAEAPQLEVLQLGQKLQGLLVLLAIFVGLSYPRPWGTATEGIAEVVESEWIMTSMAFLLVSSILKSELPGSPVEELGVGSLLVKVSTLQWFLLGWGGGDASDVGVLFLGLLALAVCLVERLATLPVEEPKPTPKPRAALKPPLPKPSFTSKPTPVAKSAAAKRALVKPPQPKMMGRKSSRASEISTAPSLPSTPRSVPSCPPRRTDEDSSSSELSTDWSSESE